MRVVFDTNIYISAFAVPVGNAEEAYLRAIKGHAGSAIMSLADFLAETQT